MAISTAGLVFLTLSLTNKTLKKNPIDKMDHTYNDNYTTLDIYTYGFLNAVNT